MPAHHSQPSADELGTTSYKNYEEDTRRYGFDTGFLRSILRSQFTLQRSLEQTPVTLLGFLQAR